MRLKEFSIGLVLLLQAGMAWAQWTIDGVVVNATTQQPLIAVDVYHKATNTLTSTDEKGFFQLNNLASGVHEVIIFAYEYQSQTLTVNLENASTSVEVALSPLSQELSEVVVSQQREKVFGLKRLMPVEGTAIYAGKKTEVVLLDQLVGNLASNNARQVYAQVVGLNIYENNDAGLQLNIGGRGLDPNRTSNFNTRQNGYDISADVLGYPESYYTPPAEALSEIQVIRGAASLQYGTQFGGLINFKMKKPVRDKKIELVSRQTVGSYGLFTTFNSLSGTVGKLSYYTYLNYKTGNGYRPNSGFNSTNYYGYFDYRLGSNTSMSFELTHLKYLSEQPGGLTDTQFAIDPTYSNRERNWFEVDWNLYALKLKHKLTPKTDLSLNLFGLDAERNALGYRGNQEKMNSNPITDLDEQHTDGSYVSPRDLIKGAYRNWGAEARLLTRYTINHRDAVFLVGSKFYKANNNARQGAGSLGTHADFNFSDESFPDYPNQSAFDFPNLNVAFFGENIFFVSDKLSFTPGFRYEYIKTESVGTYRQVNFDNAGNPIFNQDVEDNRLLERSFVLLGLGASYQQNDNVEWYGNFSQNYRSVTFSDIRTVNPTFVIDPDISDEEGFTADFGVRGKWSDYLSYDLGGFGLLYNDRIGIVLDDRANRVRKNIGKAFIYGMEAFADWNLISTFNGDANKYRLSWFVNVALTNSEYIDSEINNVIGKKVEFIPAVNLKTGLKAGYKNLLASLQYSRLSKQFTDVENSPIPLAGDSREGIIGEIPAYQIMDISLSYTYKMLRVESGVNNVLNSSYFTRRATGYPGPGIIPSAGRNVYFTLQVKL